MQTEATAHPGYVAGRSRLHRSEVRQLAFLPEAHPVVARHIGVAPPDSKICSLPLPEPSLLEPLLFASLF